MEVPWSIEARSVECHRCQGELHAAVKLPASLAGWPDGALGSGTFRIVTLCPRCDRLEPSAQGLLAFFALHREICDANLVEFGVLVQEWVHRHPPPRHVDLVAFEEDVEAWRRGDYDDSSPLA
jgi:hypothetical protein